MTTCTCPACTSAASAGRHSVTLRLLPAQARALEHALAKFLADRAESGAHLKSQQDTLRVIYNKLVMAP